jgi:gliding motility-associated-like protein
VIAGIDDLNQYTTQVYSNKGDNTFEDLGVNIIALIDGDIALADYNADGYLDIAICGRDDSNNKYSRIYKNNQNETFSDITAGLQGLCFGSMDWGDYDNDGDIDLLICGQDDSNTRKTLIYQNNGDDTFTEVMPDIPAVSRGQASWGDLNKDGYLDIALSGLGTTNNYITEMYVNDGDGTFSTHNANLTKLAFTHQHFVDYDNDGDLDFWISGQNSTGTDMVILYNNSLGNFSASSASFNALWNASAAWGDYDADGRPDLIYMGLNSTSDPTSYYYQNNGVNDFSAAEWGLIGIAEGANAWLDFDNDNKLDFFIAGSSAGGNKSILYQNDTINTNSAPVAPTNLSADVVGYEVTLSWTAPSDAQTASAGLSYHLILGTSTGNYNINAQLNSFSTKQGNIKGTNAILILPEGQYFWKIQAIDPSGEVSAASAESSFAVCDPFDLGEDKEVCLNNLLEMSVSTSETVNWYDQNDASIGSGQNLSYQVTQNGEVRVAVTKSIGCTARDTIAVTTLALPAISLPATDEGCEGKTLNFEAGETGETVKWYAQNGDLLNEGGQLAYVIGTSETIKCEVSGTNGCSDSAKIAITALPLPQASLGDDFGLCNGQSTPLTISGMQTVNWYALPWTQIATNQEQIEVAVTTDTTIVAEFTGANGCVNRDTVNIAAGKTILASAGNDTIICYNTSLVLGGNPAASEGVAPYTYSWTDENDIFFSNEANPEVNPVTNTFYKLHVSDQNGCEGSDQINVEINSQITINAGEDADVCYGSSTKIGGNPTAENSLFQYSYTWWPATGLDDPKLANPTVTLLDTTTYRLIVSTYLCEPDTDYVTLNTLPLPVITISEDINIGYGGSTLLEADGGLSYEWLPTDGLSSPNTAQTDASPEETTTYVVTVTGDNECQSQASVTVTVKNDLFIPSLFTPNGDGNNDYFRIYGTGIEVINMIVYNRNGNVVFESSDANFLQETGWDGTTNGAKQPQGSYMYVISGRFVNGSPIEYKNNRGTINLMR